MKTIKLFHNPGAGNEALSKQDLVDLINKNDFACEYSSTKDKKRKEFEPHHDIVAVAGGDGTVRKITKALLSRGILDKRYPIALLPQGTANNISKTLGIKGEAHEVIARWNRAAVKHFDVGRIYGTKEATFFIESFGYGIFPYLMLEMDKPKNKKIKTAEESLSRALNVLLELCGKYEPKDCKLIIDGEDYSGRYILAEIMNTKSIGPNLFLAPDSEPDDGFFEVVLVSEQDKDRFAEYVSSKIKGEEKSYTFKSIRAKSVLIAWEGKHVHVDDEIVRLKKGALVRVDIRENLLEFLGKTSFLF